MNYEFIEQLGQDTLRELASLCLGRQLGHGMSRNVFESNANPDVVIKVENYADHKQNVMEWLVWNQFKDVKGIGKWLCPCYKLSHSGTFLVMAKARDLDPREQPKRIPSFISDNKLENFGMFEGRVVLRDYGTITLALGDKLVKWA